MNGILALLFVGLAIAAVMYFFGENQRTLAALERILHTVTRFFRRAF
jgi:hypothetical protein